jgi:hypothetical protein
MVVDPDGGVYVLSSFASPSPGAPPPASLFVAKLGPSGTGIAWKVMLPFTSGSAPAHETDGFTCW